MKFITLYSLLISLNAFAVEQTIDCKKLINGNNNGEAYTTAKSVDLTLMLDVAGEDAEIRGTMVTKAGAYNREDGVENVWAFFTDGRKFKKQGDVITISSFDRNLFLCGMSQSPCRQWETLTYNLRSKEGTFEKSHSYKAVMGDVRYSLSIRFNCLSK